MSRQPLRILITEKADSDEEAIYKYIARKFGKIYADKFRLRIIDLFKKLAVTPTAGRIAKNDRSLRIFIFNRHNKVVYKATQTDVVIVRILSSSRKASGEY